MEEHCTPFELGARARPASIVRETPGGSPGADLERARFVAELVARAAATADETLTMADAAFTHGLVAAEKGDLAGATHQLARGMIASALAAWQLNELATDSNLQRDFAAAQARRHAAELQLATMIGRARLAAAALRAFPEADGAVSQLRATVMAFVDGSGVAQSLLAATLLPSWLRTFAAAFDHEPVAARTDASIRAYGVPRLTLPDGQSGLRRSSPTADGRPALSARERDVLGQIVAGLTTTEIAQTLGVKNTTVSTLVGRIFNKLGVNNRPAAVAVALRYGLCVGIDEPST